MGAAGLDEAGLLARARNVSHYSYTFIRLFYKAKLKIERQYQSVFEVWSLFFDTVIKSLPSDSVPLTVNF